MMMMRRLIWALAALPLIAAAPAPKGAPRRIVSVNLCADQYLMALADPGQIAALSPNARDPDLSAGAAKARRFAIIRKPGEQVLAMKPDLVIGFPDGAGGIVGAPRGDWRTLGVANAESWGAIIEQIRAVAAAIGHRDRGEAMIAAMERDLASLPRVGKAGVAAYYQRRGYMTGTGTLVDELMGRAGLTNLAAIMGRPALAQTPLEEMVARRPDWLIVESATDKVVDQGTEMLHHPALRAIPRLRLPQAWTVCGGPSYVTAARSLIAQINARRAAKRAGR
ncbi:iron complex transport system substrate-binding protein [Sphingobium fontiphilum]|uniref:Iron complex transport system substrate-binding protein n=2 Tax=Sphingobium fontiphilum TaxID=944425 RepID=A0A7W6DMB3_9SPHN|nr:iron complex transport system substrate-binding protein [Sphingobium fontiphilum]